MNGSTLQKTAAGCAEELRGARLEHPFGPGWEVFKVRSKVFMRMTELPGRPGEALALRDRSSHVTPRLTHEAEQPVDPHTCGSGTRAAR